MPLIYVLTRKFYKATLDPNTGRTYPWGESYDTPQEAMASIDVLLAECPTMKNRHLICVIEEALDGDDITFCRLQ